MHRQVNRRRGIALALNNLGFIACYHGQLEKADAYFQESRDLRKTIGDERGYGYATINLAWVRRLQGRYEEATHLIDTAMVIHRRLRDWAVITWGLLHLAYIYFDLGKEELLEEVLMETEQIGRRVGNNWSLNFSPLIRGLLLIKSGKLKEAGEYIEGGLKTSHHLENPSYGPLLFAYYCRGILKMARQEYALAKEPFLTCLKLRLKFQDKIGLAETLEAIAGLYIQLNQPRFATQLVGTARAIRERIGSPLPPRSVESHEQMVAGLRNALGQAAFEEAFTAGKRLEPEETYKLVLEEE